MTQEEKAKAYNKALKVLHKYDGANIMFSQSLKEEMFPELKESEDERIRKEILDYIIKGSESLYDVQQYGKERFEKWIAWFEKQGKNNMGISEATKKKLEDNLNKALEKETPESWNKFLDEQGKQKPADKVEPKFKVGDWIVYEENTYQIHNISLKRYYECLRTDGTVHTFDFEYIDSKSHIWTIQDAKDGDVLYECNEKKPFIFKELKHIDDITSYCDIFNGIFNPNEDSLTTWDIVPATKEQRDLLFQKMKDAGYEWDAEKKELKKIEQKPFNNQFTPEQASVLDKHIDKLLNPVWSEEDEDYFDAIIAKLEITQDDALLTDNQMNFLKSLKERVQLQHEWKQENTDDLTDFENACEWLRNYVNPTAGTYLFDEDIEKFKNYMKGE